MEDPAFKAENRRNTLLAEVGRAREATIPKRGTSLARLVPVSSSFDNEKARRAAAGLCEVSRGSTLGGIRIKDLVNEGRN